MAISCLSAAVLKPSNRQHSSTASELSSAMPRFLRASDRALVSKRIQRPVAGVLNVSIAGSRDRVEFHEGETRSSRMKQRWIKPGRKAGDKEARYGGSTPKAQFLLVPRRFYKHPLRPGSNTHELQFTKTREQSTRLQTAASKNNTGGFRMFVVRFRCLNME